MENNFTKVINDNKGFVIFYLIWFLLHLILISTGVQGGGESGLWPFGDTGNSYYAYNFKDLIFWLIIPIVIWAIWKLIQKI